MSSSNIGASLGKHAETFLAAIDAGLSVEAKSQVRQMGVFAGNGAGSGQPSRAPRLCSSHNGDAAAELGIGWPGQLSATPVREPAQNGQSLLVEAAVAGVTELVEGLLDRGATVEGRSKVSDELGATGPTWALILHTDQ